MIDITRTVVGQWYGVFACLVAAIWLALKRHRQRQTEQLFARQHGCQPLRRWKTRWPLGLDMVVKAFESGRRMQILQYFLQVIDESGTTFEQRLLGGRSIDTINPENIEAILSTNFNGDPSHLTISWPLQADSVHSMLRLQPRSPFPTFKPLLGHGIFTKDGTAWRFPRHLLRPQFASNRRQAFEQVKKCVQGIIDAVPQNGIVDLQPLCFRLTFETTLFLLLGDFVSAADWGQVNGQESEFAKAFNVAQEYLAHRGRLGPLYWLLNDRAFRDACKTCHRFIDNAVAKALQGSARGSQRSNPEVHDNGKDGCSFVEALVQKTRDPQVIRDRCLNVLLAGRDTTGCCLQWTFRLLARHQCVLDRLRTEIERISGLGASAPPPTRDQLKQMSYLTLVIKEVLRLYPSVPVNSREAVRLTTLPVGGGPDGRSPVLVRPGEGVGYCVYAMHRRKYIYGEDAEQFRPERWEGDALKGVRWAYLPFNGGPRLCLGQEFALLEVAYTVARMVQVFPSITVAPGEAQNKVGQEKQTLTLVLSSAERCVVSLEPWVKNLITEPVAPSKAWRTQFSSVPELFLV